MSLQEILGLLHGLSTPDQLAAAIGIVWSVVVRYFPSMAEASGRTKLLVFGALSFSIPLIAAIAELTLWHVNSLIVVDTAIIVNVLIAAFIAGLMAFLSGTGVYHFVFRKDK